MPPNLVKIFFDWACKLGALLFLLLVYITAGPVCLPFVFPLLDNPPPEEDNVYYNPASPEFQAMGRHHS